MSARSTKLVTLSLCLLAAALMIIGIAGLDRLHRVAQGVADLPLDQEVSVLVVGENDRLLRPFLTSTGYWRLPTTLGDVDPRLIDHLIAYEDQRFYDHDGVDELALFRAGGQFLRYQRIVSGASTLTMQVARLLSGEETRTAMGKFRQMVHARQLESRLSKRGILEIYLNRAPYGGNIEGVRAASYAYFGKEPKWLTLAEIALLVALPQAPEIRRPDRNWDNAHAARSHVLRRLHKRGAISEADMLRAIEEPLPDKRRTFPRLAPHLAQDLFASRSDGEPVLRTSIDPILQASLETHLAERSLSLGQDFAIAVLVAEHSTGRIRAAIGGREPTSQSSAAYVNMIDAVRSPGSTLKPMIYGLAFDQGIAHPETLISDRPRAFDGYAPENFDTGYHGTMTIAEALRLSLNIPAVAVLERVDPHRLASRLRRAGLEPRFPAGARPSLAMGLGGVGVTLKELVELYGGIARGGTKMDLAIDPAETSPPSSRFLSENAADLITQALWRSDDRHQSNRSDLIYKTGTAYGYRDAWTIGYDGQHVVGVWVGRPDGASAGNITGTTTALPLFLDVFARIKSVPHKATLGADLTLTDLPTHLKHFDRSAVQDVSVSKPEIAFPQALTELVLRSNRADVPLKVRGGTPPYTWLANGVPVRPRTLRRETSYQPDGPGFARLTVIDGAGRTDTVSVRLIK